MSSIDTTNWKKFKISKLFDVHPTNAYKLTNTDIYKIEGKTPVLSNSSVNNGVGGYSGLKPTEAGNIITFSDTTTGATQCSIKDNLLSATPMSKVCILWMNH